MKRRLFLWIDFHSGFEEALDYEAACSAKYVLDNDEAWNAYTKARDEFIEQFRNIRVLAKRAPMSADELAEYDESRTDTLIKKVD